MKKLSITVIISLFVSACFFDEEEFDDLNSKDLIRIDSISSSSALADGVESVTIFGHITDEAAFENRKVVLKTTHGSFAVSGVDTIEVKADDEFKISASLRATSEGDAIVTAEAFSVTSNKSDPITYTKAFPQGISVSVDSLAISNSFNDSVTIKASLSRANGGVPSSGHQVSFYVTDSNDNSVGFFLNGNNTASTDGNGLASIVFTAGNTSLTADEVLTIRAETSGKTADDSADMIYENTTEIYLDIL